MKQKNQSASWRIKSRNWPEDYDNLKLMPAQTAPSCWHQPGGRDFLTAYVENFKQFLFGAANKASLQIKYLTLFRILLLLTGTRI
jgi:hypothetical protein